MKIIITILFLMICLIVNGQTNQGIIDVINLSKSGITNTIIKSYIDTSTNKLSLDATNIIILKQSGVADDIILHMMNKKTNVVEKVTVQPFDPESYDFFYRYYMFPRTLRYSYDLQYRR